MLYNLVIGTFHLGDLAVMEFHAEINAERLCCARLRIHIACSNCNVPALFMPGHHCVYQA